MRPQVSRLTADEINQRRSIQRDAFENWKLDNEVAQTARRTSLSMFYARQAEKRKELAWEKKKRRLETYPEFEGKKPKWPGHNPMYYRDREDREFARFSKLSPYMQKQERSRAAYLADLSAERNLAKEGPNAPRKPTFRWIDNGWMKFSDHRPPLGTPYEIIYDNQDMEKYWKSVIQAKKEAAIKKLRFWRNRMAARLRLAETRKKKGIYKIK